MSHFQQSVRHYENAGDRFNAGIGRRNMALALAADGRASEALSYARAALQDYETAGAGETAEGARQLAARLEG